MVEEMDSRLNAALRGTVLGSPVRLPPVGDLWLPGTGLLSPFFSRRNIEKERGLSPGQGRGTRTAPAPNQS